MNLTGWESRTYKTSSGASGDADPASLECRILQNKKMSLKIKSLKHEAAQNIIWNIKRKSYKNFVDN